MTEEKVGPKSRIPRKGFKRMSRLAAWTHSGGVV